MVLIEDQMQSLKTSNLESLPCSIGVLSLVNLLLGLFSHPPNHQGSPFDVIVVPQVVSLSLLLHAVQYGHRGHKVHHLPSGQEVKVGPAVPASIAIAGEAQGWLRSLFSLSWLNGRES